ncbi:MAG: hypothetical protein QNK05_01610 [Myxococcota bacterium]|nr:hypothetical protein [Myxococcota bacterium]
MSETLDPTAPDPAEPPALFVEEPSPGAPLEVEYTSRGDRVPATVFRPAAPKSPLELLVLLDSEGGSHASAAALAADGAFVFVPDLPLCARRATPKLSDQLATPPPGDLLPEERERLIEAARQQALCDVRQGLRLLPTLCPELPEDVSGELVASGGFAAGIADALVGVEPRLRLRAAG